MTRFLKKKSGKIGLPPGTLVHIGDQKIEKARIRVIDYDDERLIEREVDSIEECFPFRDADSTTWINIDGLHDVELFEKLAQHFNIHTLVMEDIVNTDHRPKVEESDEYFFITLKMIYTTDKNHEFDEEQMSFVLGKNFVISFQERIGDVFEPVRERIRTGKIRLRKRKADHLAYALLDAIIDNYFIVLEKFGEAIEDFEEGLLTDPPADAPQTILGMKRKIISLRRSVWPVRELISDLQTSESELLTEPTFLYLRDVYDHIIQIMDTIDSFRDTITGLLDTYNSAVSNRMNEVMKVLTIIATIFIPLTFIAGIYGMNFEHMPELSMRWAYPLGFWSLMVGLLSMMVYYFKKKNWL